ncbi:MAG: rhodanese-like domain-containing protein [Winogradskyella sp.]|nr:rhodanese-like domain-containing protein [Winogradskyella sp.]MBT8375400.1 rhodanese-like domain-containing protein [Bacteroidia bacterium]NNC45733.1 rhodanese-like domain-containing protein [Winogradskyella sp.]NNF86524.1 rhodanese-like domain-containing protein [Winogradskyella sp.]NNK39292.1 rhodanese-like domain-containing protein [Winogradskyella sp.]
MGLLNLLFGNKSEAINIYLEKNAVLLDVRSNDEFSQGHLPGALHIPLQELEYRVEEILKLKKPVIAYCASGARSDRATNFLKLNKIDAINGGGINSLRSTLKH